MIHILSKEKINKHFSDEKIQAYMQKLGLTKLECILYLWFYNNAQITLYDFKKDNGRPMFVKFAKSITDLINECKKDKTVIDEIEEICKVNPINTCWTALNLCDKCKEKEECGLQSPLFKLDAISNIIKRAKEGVK